MSANLETVNKIMHEVIRENYNNGLRDTELNADVISTEMMRVLSECTEHLDEKTYTLDEIREIIRTRIDRAVTNLAEK